MTRPPMLLSLTVLASVLACNATPINLPLSDGTGVIIEDGADNRDIPRLADSTKDELIISGNDAGDGDDIWVIPVDGLFDGTRDGLLDGVQGDGPPQDGAAEGGSAEGGLTPDGTAVDTSSPDVALADGAPSDD